MYKYKSIMKKIALFFLCKIFLLLNINSNQLYAQNNTYLCITSDVKIDYKNKPFLYASKDNINTDGSGRSNYYESVQRKHPKIKLSSIFFDNYYLLYNDDKIVLNNLNFKKDNNTYINIELNIYIGVSHNENNLILHIKNSKIKHYKDINIHLLCSKNNYEYKTDNLKKLPPIWLKLFE